MQNNPRLSSKVVFVGNVPYGVTEEQLIDIFREVGPVVSFRLMFDRDNKPRGFGFCEYQDAETAKSAIRNLNNYEIGNRQLRVDQADQEHIGTGIDGLPLDMKGPPGPPPGMPSNAGVGPIPSRLGNSMPAAIPPGSLGSGPNAPPLHPEAVMDAINNTVRSMNPPQLFDILNQLKMMAQQEPEKARQLLLVNPQFTYVIVEALILLGLVRPEVIHSIMQSQSMPPGPQASGAPFFGRYDGPPPQGGPIPPMIGGEDDRQQALMMQVRNMSIEQINSFPPDQRDHFLYLRSRMML